MYIFVLFIIGTIVVHELGHLFMAIICKVDVEAFSIGFFKPYVSFKWKNIEWRFSPWLLGGYCKLKGETKKVKGGFLIQPYRKKLLIVLAGVFINFLVACICYLINYGNIFVGIYIDWHLFLTFFTNEPYLLKEMFQIYNPNILLLELSFINLICCVSNLAPIPALDGSYVFLPWLEYIWKKDYVRRLNYLTTFGFYFLMSFQVFFIGLNWRLYVIS